MHESEKKLLHDIETYGWHVVGVFDPENKRPNFCYSVGAYMTYNQAEIVIFGLQIPTMHQIVNNVFELMKAKTKIVAHKPYPDLINGHNCIFRPVDKKYYPEHFGAAMQYYKGTDFPVLQCYWPDRNGLFPWQPRCNEVVSKLQTVIPSKRGH